MDTSTAGKVILVLLFTLLPVSANAEVCFDGGTVNESNLQGYGDTGSQRAAQEFTLSVDSTIDSIEAYSRRNGGRADDGFYSIWSESGGAPSTQLEACDNAPTGSSFGWTTSICNGDVYTAGTYFAVLDASTQSGNNFHNANADSGSSWDYVGGSWGPGNNDSLNLGVKVNCTEESSGGGSPSVGTSTYATSTQITYYDWIFMESAKLFFLALIGMGILFTLFKQPMYMARRRGTM